MIGLLAVAVGITIGASVISFICDELSESEREKQSQMKSKYSDYEESRLRDIEQMNHYKSEQINRFNSQINFEIESLYTSYYQRLGQKRRELLLFYSNAVEERINEKRELSNEIKITIKLVLAATKKQNTMLRSNALTQLIRELEEAKEKVNAYLIYLNKYKKYINYYYISTETETPEPFEFFLPKNFLYKGKLVYWEKSKIQEHGKISINNAGDLKYCFKEFEFINDYEDGSIIPLMGDDFNKETFEITLSLEKGQFKNTVTNTPRIGITAEVVKYSERKNIILKYGNSLKLKLPKRNLANPKRPPLIGAFLRVFPVKWDFSLSFKEIEVSERPTDALSNYSFQDIPVVFTDSSWDELYAFLEKHSLLNSEDEWKIAPFDETTIPNVNQVKLQLGTDLIFLASIKSAHEDGKEPFFKYEQLLDFSDYSMKPDDVFVAIDCTLNVVLESDMHELNVETYRNMGNLSMMVFSEFKLQYQMKISQSGMQYFNKWAEVTDKLITFLYKGKNIETEIKYFDKEDYFDKKIDGFAYRIYFKQSDVIKEYVERIYSVAYKPRNVEFFIEISLGQYVFIEFSQDCTYMRVYGSGVDEYFLNNPKDVRIYSKSFCYAEYQQSAALHAFRVGKLANPFLQVCAMDGKHINSETEPFLINQFFNENLPSDISQKIAVEKALNEKNIFLIQGPPGTGKTTVIREIITQFISSSEYSRILVVSQANVAVDNVLRGLINIFPDKLVRCGQADKIDDSIQHISFETKYKNYVDKLLEKKDTNCNQDILNKWLEIVDPENGYNPDVGELIMKGHKVIGATCVGLAKKRIGLDRIIFDLVVIDEAGKALPAEILIPYIKAKKIILIGDHKQLPPTVNTALFDESKIEMDDRDIFSDQLFNESFFYRMFENAPQTNKCMLSTQYRMPSVIGTLISRLFYNGELVNGYGTDDKKTIYFQSNINLIDMSNVHDYHENIENSVSVINNYEAGFVCSLIANIRKSVHRDKARIAVITPYKGQKRIIIKTMLNNGINLNVQKIDVNTVDAFQGDEAEIVIYCTTRASKPTKYFSDLRRVNVALSRAKNDLVIIGSLKYFYRFKEPNAILPQIADYIKLYGMIINPNSINQVLFQKTDMEKDIISIDLIVINDEYLKIPISRDKIDKVKEYYYKTGELDKFIEVIYDGEKYILVDKYIRYVAAKEMHLLEVAVIINMC